MSEYGENCPNDYESGIHSLDDEAIDRLLEMDDPSIVIDTADGPRRLSFMRENLEWVRQSREHERFYRNGGAVALIDLDEFEADRCDPEWQRFLHASLEHRQKLRREGRLG